MTDTVDLAKVRGATPDPELLALLEKAKTLPPPTPRQHIEQRRSWVRGEMGMDHPEMTAEALDALLLHVPEFALLAECEAQADGIKALKEALQGLLNHACIADAAPEDVDEEDRRRERVARRLLHGEGHD